MGGTGDHERSPRGAVVGWSAASARRQMKWLWTVAAGDLDGFGYAVTLTMRNTPETAAAFHKLRRAWIMRATRMGATRIHWVIEWQARGTPHLHAAVYFQDEPAKPDMLGIHWMVIAGDYGTSMRSQDVQPITGSVGWLKYLAKHASRGANHYQRAGHPEGWEKTGRLWGHVGDWPTVEPVELGLSNALFYRTRRILRRWAESDARASSDWKRLAYLRRSGRPGNARESRYQGVSEWLPETVTMRLEDFLRREQSFDQ